jgi:SAM-dependent methyltransferase
VSKGIYHTFRLWQKESTGHAIFCNAKLEVEKLMLSLRPKVVVQLEGRALLDHFDEDVVYYHLSEEVNVEARGYSIEYEQGFLPFPDQSVELILVGHALELYQNQQAFINDLERVLAPKGVVLITTLVNRWLGTIPPSYHPLGDLKVAPKSMRSIRKLLGTVDLDIVDEVPLVSDPSVIMMSERLKETIIYPIALKVQRHTPQWTGIVGAAE